MELGTGYLNNTGDRVRFTDPSGAEDDRYSCSTTQYDTVFHRIGDEGAWCDAIKRTANPATFA